MATGISTRLNDNTAFENQTINKAFNRIVWFLFFLYLLAFVDRTNIAFASLAMNKDLKLTATMYGLSQSIFFAGYVVCEMPSNMMLARFGARKWLARIMFTWGIAACACMFASGTRSLYIFRLILGMAEAGFLPGVLLYLTYWFPQTYRARAVAFFLIAQPCATAIAAALSGVILDHFNGWLGISGWRWLFVLEGFPSIVFGIVSYFYLIDSPSKAKWLTAPEKAALENRLRREEVQPAARKVWRQVFSRNPILLAIANFGMVIGLMTNSTWSPQIVREVVKMHSLSFVGLLTAVAPICAIIATPLLGRHSDKHRERAWHFSVAILLAAFGLLLVGFLKTPDVRIVGLIVATAFLFAAQPIFWAVVPNVLSPAARPVGIAFISMCGVLGSVVSPIVIGSLKDLTNGWGAGFLFSAFMMVVSVTIILTLSIRQKAVMAVAASGK